MLAKLLKKTSPAGRRPGDAGALAAGQPANGKPCQCLQGSLYVWNLKVYTWNTEGPPECY